MTTDESIGGLPGESLVRQGLADIAAGRHTVQACVIAIARSRFTRAGLLPATASATHDEPERELYRLLREQGGDAYSRYNSLLRELVSFESALDVRLRRSK